MENTLESLLEWYIDAGVTETIGRTPRNYTAERSLNTAASKHHTDAQSSRNINTSPPSLISQFSPVPPAVAMEEARKLAEQAHTREALEKAVREFDGCILKRTAQHTVFSDGTPECTVMVIGEAPGAQEDMQGIPFCGPSGQLLDKVIASIGLSRKENTYISNTIFWRPPGNRKPSPEELAVCQPFVEKHIALIQPKLLLLSGGTAVSGVLQSNESISRLRGKVHAYRNRYLQQEIPAIATFHPSYLLRSPGQKRLVWQDMLFIQDMLNDG